MQHEQQRTGEVYSGMVTEATERLDALSTAYASDPAMAPLTIQLRNHLEHVTYSFAVARDSEDFPYRVDHLEAYPPTATERAVQKVADLQQWCEADSNSSGRNYDIDLIDLGIEAKEQQRAVVDELFADPTSAARDFAARRATYGSEASFPELGGTVKGLFADMAQLAYVNRACNQSSILTQMRTRLMDTMYEAMEADTYAYESTLYLIEDALAFFDIAVRTHDPDAPPIFHSQRFEYNWHSLSQDPEHTVLPVMTSLTTTELMKLRGVPIGLLGVSTTTLTVDGFPQTPYEFFMHDVDHTRRMHEETKLGIEREGVTHEQYEADATQLIHEVLLPEIDIEGIRDTNERDRRIAMRMILFEILHEDAYDPTRDTIAEALLRPPMERTPFERLTEDNVVEFYMAPRASTLAHVFRKLAHTFYDLPERRSTSLGTDFVRTRSLIAQGAADLYKLVSDDPIEYDALLTTCEDLVSTDEGFTDGFIGNIAHDINRRAVGRSTLQLMVSRPLGVAGAVRKVREYGDHIHSLFGYSALEYEDPEALEQRVVTDLAAFDADNTAIAIGATPYGIGRLYPVVKELGFTTLGIVASTALGKNEECAEGVDGIVVVRDTGWGGYRYAQRNGGLLSPTTRVFVGASDSIAAYGGGNITAVTLQEAKRRGKQVSFTPFDMNHRIADMMHGQHGQTDEIDYRGPAHARWQTL